jgi:hypothetical protein
MPMSNLLNPPSLTSAASAISSKRDDAALNEPDVDKDIDAEGETDAGGSDQLETPQWRRLTSLQTNTGSVVTNSSKQKADQKTKGKSKAKGKGKTKAKSRKNEDEEWSDDEGAFEKPDVQHSVKSPEPPCQGTLWLRFYLFLA